MIQRIQSVFLFFSTAILISLFFVNIAQFDVDNTIVTLNAYQYSYNDGKMIENTHILYQQVALIGIIAIINFITIFLFKKRILQMRLCVYSSILQVALIGMLAFYIYLGQADDNEFVKIGLGAIFPIISLILTIMSFFSIRKDERLVRSLDRIR